MKNNLKKLTKLRSILGVTCGVSVLTITLSSLGSFQSLELSTLDRWFRLRPPESKERRIVVVTIDESDINQLEQWPISDETLSQLITKISRQEPRAIGLDLYRDIPVKPGTEKLAAVLRSTPNLVGIEKAIDDKVKPSPILEEQGQIALADLVIDPDQVVRRGLLSIQLENNKVQLGLAARLALMYLAAEGVELEAVENKASRALGKSVFVPFESNDGGYVRADAGGFQILLNFRGTENSFQQVSIFDVLTGNIPQDLMSDRLVIIGSTAQSLNDFFAIPYSSNRGGKPQYLPGVLIHANLASQIISAALDGRQLIKVVNEPVEWLWIVTWTGLGSAIGFILSNNNSFDNENLSLLKFMTIGLVFPGIIVLGSSYLLFLAGWWLPAIAPCGALFLAILAASSYQQQKEKKLAFIDGLTQIPNRRFFDQFLSEHWSKSQKKQQTLCVILCDVDFFKKYNDTYGHQAGDVCLQKVAKVISKAIRSNDLAARYGGEEFVVVLPNATPEIAIMIAKRICDRLRKLQIPHASSRASKFVSISCGIATTHDHMVSSSDYLVAHADRALYLAKEQGRDRYILVD
ncbi:diguanylate cyclase (GGDEF) domain-containing protein [Xenococcus sp. PCC 7305]|uniref:CHASE2 domain-containing protein n=1 Tax=Xenococcus sp. PCC 7305 TaxID=102125 RepID=UPI0002AB9A7B|nr:CHASE2 domain-containing protein [Xenococcus sp. PCC 7305]ELS05095.1 diguanylate cyclase (GGDEF) domain-containing protein [Xenococcus sp. PCC 7305]